MTGRFEESVLLDLAVWDDDSGDVLWAVSAPVLLRSRGASIIAAAAPGPHGAGAAGGGGGGESRYVLVHEDDDRGWLWMELLAVDGANQQTGRRTFSVQAATLSLLLLREAEAAA